MSLPVLAFSAPRWNADEVGQEDNILSDNNPLELQIIPNPANQETRFAYSLKTEASVTVEILDALQRVVETPLRQKPQTAARYGAAIDASRLSPGVYTVRVTALKADGTVIRANKQLVIVR